MGLRVNPGLSFLDDERYDPVRPHSKLGVPIDDLAAAESGGSHALAGLEGVLVHSNCESTDFSELRQTVDCLEENNAGYPGAVGLA